MKIQEMFNTVVCHLIKQGHAAMSPSGVCAYRDVLSDDTCAAGCLVPPEEYDPSWEGHKIDDIKWFKDLAATSENEDKFHRVLRALQDIHDGESEYRWKTHLRAVAQREGLELPDCLSLED